MIKQEDFDLLKQEVDTLQIEVAASKLPWYRNTSNIVAILALLFSFGTTVVSYLNSINQDKIEARREARTLIQRTTKLPIENLRLLNEFRDLPEGHQLSGFINQENILLASQVAELVRTYEESFTSTEFFAVATALAQSALVEDLPYFYEKAIQKANNANDYATATRAYAAYLCSSGQVDEGRSYFVKSEKVWDQFPSNNIYVTHSINVTTYMFWSQTEGFLLGNCSRANELIELAQEAANNLLASSFKQSLLYQINDTRLRLSQCSSSP